MGDERTSFEPKAMNPNFLSILVLGTATAFVIDTACFLWLRHNAAPPRCIRCAPELLFQARWGGPRQWQIEATGTARRMASGPSASPSGPTAQSPLFGPAPPALKRRLWRPGWPHDGRSSAADKQHPGTGRSGDSGDVRASASGAPDRASTSAGSSRLTSDRRWLFRRYSQRTRYCGYRSRPSLPLSRPRPGQAIRYGIGVGREGFAWSGTAEVKSKQEWPEWFPTADMMARDRAPQLGRKHARWPRQSARRSRSLSLARQHRHALPHPRNQRAVSIGQAVSSGCIRMFNQDAVDLYNRVAEKQQEPGWKNTLTGIPKEIYVLWRKYLRERGYRLRAQIVDFPEGIPGQISR